MKIELIHYIENFMAFKWFNLFFFLTRIFPILISKGNLSIGKEISTKSNKKYCKILQNIAKYSSPNTFRFRWTLNSFFLLRIDRFRLIMKRDGSLTILSITRKHKGREIFSHSSLRNRFHRSEMISRLD